MSQRPAATVRARLSPLDAVSIGLATVGLAVSAALLADYLGPTPAYCAEGGCATVRASGWARPLGIPMPLLGVLFFAGAMGLAAVAPRLATARRVHAGLGGVLAIALIVVQGAVVGAWCKLCLVTDAVAIGHGILVLIARPATAALPSRRLVGIVAAIATAAIAVPLAGMTHRDAGRAAPTTAALPAPIAELQEPGRAVVVDFADFECPFCRTFHHRFVEAMSRLDRAAAATVTIHRKMVPLSQHPGAMPAARAYVCAEAQQRGDAMADALFAVATTELTTAGCERIAADLGLDLPAFRACVPSTPTTARIDGDLLDAGAAKIRSLPTVFIGHERFAGAAATTAELEASLRRAIAGSYPLHEARPGVNDRGGPS